MRINTDKILAKTNSICTDKQMEDCLMDYNMHM